MSAGSRDGGPPSLSITGAAQVLRPPRDHLQHLRGDELTAQTLDPGDVAARDGRITALERDDPIAEVTIDASGCAVLPGVRRLPHASAVRRLALGRVRAEADRRALRGDLAPRGRDHVLGPGAARGLRRRGARPGVGAGRGDAAPRARRRSSASPATACRARGSCARSCWPASSRSASRRRRSRPRCWPTPCPDGYTADSWMDEVEEMMPEVVAAGSVTALDIFVESIAFGLVAPGADGRAGGGRRAGAAHSCRAALLHALGAGGAGRRAPAASTTSR